MELRSGRRLRSSGTAPIGFASAMELRSGRRICSSQQVRIPEDLGPDRISALPDDLLLIILARLRSIVTAARTGILSRRWRNLWTLLSTLIFHNVKYSSLEPVLARLVSPAVSLLEIHIPITRRQPDRWDWWEHMSPVEVYMDAGVTSLLRAAARLEPEELVFTIDKVKGSHVDVPYFRRAASIVLKANTFSAPFHMPPGVEFVALDTLSLSCSITGLDDLISRCPRLRVLRLKVPTKNYLVMVHSTSLQQLFVNTRDGTSRVDIDAPVLRRLSMSLRPYRQLDISVMAPMMETISWYCSYCYVRLAPGFGSWRLNELRIQMAQRQEELPSLHIDASMVCPLFLNYSLRLPSVD
nr:F-box/FBD/LRR-repeat protein At5g53840-like [Lolium perenne]